MNGEPAADRLRLTGLVMARRLERASALLRHPLSRFMQGRTRAPRRLVMAPQDIRTADPTVATDIYSGYFVFDGKALATRGTSPFALPPPSEAWAASLASFGWLRHLRAADTALARANARALVQDWMTLAGRPNGGPGWRRNVTARRVLAFLSQSPLILDGADEVFYRRFTRSLARQADALKLALAREGEGPGRLLAAVALAAFTLCTDEPAQARDRAARRLSDEIAREILPDGGHIGRNPAATVEILLDLLPLRQLFVARGAVPPPPLLHAIDRMIPFVRAMRHGDGGLALFNGAGASRLDALATILAYDEGGGPPPSQAPYAGYQRIDAGPTVVIIDAGAPPPPAFSAEAHAGTLAFELSSGPQRIIVNCGAPTGQASRAREAARTTAAHSTLVLADRSSSRIAPRGPLAGLVYAGPGLPDVARHVEADGTALSLSHDGYVARFGFRHLRRLWLSRDGRQLVGEDALEGVGRRGPPPDTVPAVLRFHLHPSLRGVLARGGSTVVIACPDGQRWVFSASEGEVAIEESIFFAGSEGPRRTDQIVVRTTAAGPPVRWSLTQEGPPAP